MYVYISQRAAESWCIKLVIIAEGSHRDAACPIRTQSQSARRQRVMLGIV